MPLPELLASYEQTRLQERVALAMRRNKVAALNPAFAQLSQRHREIMQHMTASIKGGAPAASATALAKAELAEVESEERALLLQAGLPSDYLTLKHHCALCYDTGYVGSPQQRMCGCLAKRLLEEQRFSSQINPTDTFEAFDVSIFPTEAQKKQMLRAKQVTFQYTDSLPDPPKHNLILLGEAGLGKTYLLNCIAAQAVAKGILLKKVTAYTLLDDVLEGIRQNMDNTGSYLKVPLLLIDDLGTEPLLNNITREYLFSILNERRNGKRATVIATNLTLEKLQERYGERVFSRLISADDAALLQLSGDNLRLLNRAGKLV